MASFFGRLATLDKKKLTSREQKIIEYIQDNLKHITDEELRIDTLTQEIGVGTSAVYGLIKKLNFNGYRDLLSALIEDATTEQPLIAKNDDIVAADYVSIIKQNYAIIDKKSLLDSLQLINSANRIFISYWEGVLRGPANEMENFLYDENINAYLFDNDWDTLVNKIDKLQANDLFIFYTKYGNSKHLEKAIEMVKAKNGKVIYISGRLAPLKISRLADSIHTLIVDSMNQKGQSNVIISKTVPFHYFNDLLFYHFKNATLNR